MTTTRSRAARLRQRAPVAPPNGVAPSPADRRSSASEPPLAPAPPVMGRIRVEPMIYAVALALAALTRFGSLAADPLAPWETTTAVAARALTLGAPDGVGAPLPEVVTAAAFFLFGPSEFSAPRWPGSPSLASRRSCARISVAWRRSSRRRCWRSRRSCGESAVAPTARPWRSSPDW